MASHYIVPTFNKAYPNKVHNDLEVTGKNNVSHSTSDGAWLSAIATASIPATVHGEYVFAVRIDNIGEGFVMIGVTPMETFDSNKESRPGWNGMTGSAMSLSSGNYWPGSNQNLIDSKITEKALEVIVVVTIANNGAQKLIRWIVDGTSSANRDCTADCNGNKLFPVVSFGNDNQRITTIPIDQITIRNDEVNKLIAKCAKQSSTSTNQCAVANNNQNQSSPTGNPSNVHVGNNNTQQQSSAAFAQLQQELENERKRADLAESQLQDEKKNTSSQLQQKDQQLQQKDSEITQLKQQLRTFQSQLNNNNNSPSPFVKDKLFQIDFAANGLPLPTDRSTFGSLLPVAPTSPIFLEAKKLMRKLGSFLPSQKPVAGFTLEGVDVIAQSASGFDDTVFRLQKFRTHGGGIFNPSTTKYSAEQLQVLIYLNKLFLDRPSDAHDKAPDLINVFHGTKRGVLQSAVNGLVAVRSTDAGFFGLGAYTTPNIEYAARYAMGEFNPTSTDFSPRADGSFPVIWCVAAVGVCYPLTREKDYGQNKQWNGMNVSDFFGSPLKSDANGKFDCHCVLVNESANYQAVPRDQMQYMEIVFDQTYQVLPIAVLWMKPL